MIDKSTKELERALNPREWDKELNEAWHKNIPDLQKAFDAIKNIAIKRAEDKMKHEIDIEGLPEGWEAVEFRVPLQGESIIDFNGDLIRTSNNYTQPRLIVKKKQPRRIVLEETGKTGQPEVGEYVFNNGNLCLCRKPERWGNEHEIWRIVEDSGENDD